MKTWSRTSATSESATLCLSRFTPSGKQNVSSAIFYTIDMRANGIPVPKNNSLDEDYRAKGFEGDEVMEETTPAKEATAA